MSATSPLPAATSVPPSSTITATFARAVEPSSISFAVLDSANTPLPARLATTLRARRRHLRPIRRWRPDQIHGRRSPPQPAAGAGMAAPVQWSFTTAKPPAAPGVCPCTLFDDADGPSTIAGHGDDGVRAGRSPLRRTHRGTSLVSASTRPAQNTGTHTIALWKADGTQLATATVTNESTSGWQRPPSTHQFR